jgi:hypothetical protein
MKSQPILTEHRAGVTMPGGVSGAKGDGMRLSVNQMFSLQIGTGQRLEVAVADILP